MDAALAHLRDSGHPVRDEDAARLSPLGDSHLNLVGRYSFPSATVPGLRPLRQPHDHRDQAT
jgi:hypothetical protein